eukprot:992716-Prymnesium_polylepis.1
MPVAGRRPSMEVRPRPRGRRAARSARVEAAAARGRRSGGDCRGRRGRSPGAGGSRRQRPP